MRTRRRYFTRCYAADRETNAALARRTRQSDQKMRKLVTTFLAGSMLVFGAVACDDNSQAEKI